MVVRQMRSVGSWHSRPLLVAADDLHNQSVILVVDRPRTEIPFRGFLGLYGLWKSRWQSSVGSAPSTLQRLNDSDVEWLLCGIPWLTTTILEGK